MASVIIALPIKTVTVISKFPIVFVPTASVSPSLTIIGGTIIGTLVKKFPFFSIVKRGP